MSQQIFSPILRRGKYMHEVYNYEDFSPSLLNMYFSYYEPYTSQIYEISMSF